MIAVGDTHLLDICTSHQALAALPLGRNTSGHWDLEDKCDCILR